MKNYHIRHNRFRKAIQSMLSYLLVLLLLSGSILLGPNQSFAQISASADAGTDDGAHPDRYLPSTMEELRLLSTMSGSSQPTSSATSRLLSTTKGGRKYDAIAVEFTSKAARARLFSDLKRSSLRGIHVITVIDQFADLFVEQTPAGNSSYSQLVRNSSVVKTEWLQFDIDVPPPPDARPSDVQSQAIPEKIVRGGFNDGSKHLKGKGVIIAIVDSGVDFRHKDFIDYKNDVPTSRIKFLWDTGTAFQRGRGSISPIKYPNGSSIGTLYTQAQLTAELRRNRPTIPLTDEHGHGTACAGIAAGNGNADFLGDGLKRSEVVGVAPEAHIVAIRLGPRTSLENTYLINAFVEWLDHVAGKSPLVVSGSYGNHGTGHDGQTILERQLSARFPLSKAGRAILFAAGNEGNKPIHAELKLTGGASTVSWSARTPTSIRIYFNNGDKHELRDGNNMQIPECPAGALGKDRPCAYSNRLNGITRQMETTLAVPAGRGTASIRNRAGKESIANMYFGGTRSGIFEPQHATRSHLVGSPGTTENAITVGSYDWNDLFYVSGKSGSWDGVTGAITPGKLSEYSSVGPLRSIGRGFLFDKPEIVAPGQIYKAPAPRRGGLPILDKEWLDPTDNYQFMNGTSAATPYVAGIVALMFEKKPTLRLGDVKKLLADEATTRGLQPNFRTSPDKEWGYGKLDLSAIERIFRKI